MWTKLIDKYSGGGIKVPPYEEIYIQASRKDAIVIFYNMFGRNPNNVTCDCCGEDYSVSEFETLEQATAINCRVEGIPPAEYVKREEVLIIREDDIDPEDRVGEVPHV